MKPIKVLAICFASLIGIGVPSSLWTTHELTKHTIWRQVIENALPVGNGAKVEKSAWDSLVSKLFNLEIKTEGLKKIRNLATSENKSNELKEWCSYSYKRIYGSAIKIKNKDLLEDVKNACIVKIKDQLGDKKIDFVKNSENHKELLQKKIIDLKNLSQDKVKDLDSSLKNIREKAEPIDNNNKEYKNWRALQKYCIANYEKGYQGHNSKRWKLVNSYCINS